MILMLSSVHLKPPPLRGGLKAFLGKLGNEVYRVQRASCAITPLGHGFAGGELSAVVDVQNAPPGPQLFFVFNSVTAFQAVGCKFDSHLPLHFLNNIEDPVVHAFYSVSSSEPALEG
jgi:hypothetical protein